MHHNKFSPIHATQAQIYSFSPWVQQSHTSIFQRTNAQFSRKVLFTSFSIRGKCDRICSHFVSDIALTCFPVGLFSLWIWSTLRVIHLNWQFNLIRDHNSPGTWGRVHREIRGILIDQDFPELSDTAINRLISTQKAALSVPHSLLRTI